MMVLPISKLVTLVPVICVVSILVYRDLLSELQGEPGAYKMLQTPSGKADPEMKTILLWTPWWNEQGWNEFRDWMIPSLGFSWDGNAHVGLEDFGCDHESYKCTVTSNRSYLEDVNMFDGLMFHQMDITADLPDKTKRKVTWIAIPEGKNCFLLTSKLPSKANQVYIFQTRESPTPIGFNIGPETNNNFFNVTHSYSSKSAMHRPYGKFVKIREHPEGKDLDNFISMYGKHHTRQETRAHAI